MKSGSLVVRHHSPWRHRLIVAASIAGILIAGWGIYVLGQHQAGFDRLSAGETTQKLRDVISQLQAEKEELRTQVALVERSTQMDKQAYTEVDTNLKSLQSEILELREEVSFYRGIVAPKESSTGIRIERLKLDQANDERVYRYNLVITQVLKNDKIVEGVVDVVVTGLQDGRLVQLALDRLATSGRKRLDFQFRYFQRFEGDMLLPEGFSPRTVEISVKPRQRKEVESSFDWQALLSGTGLQSPQSGVSGSE